MFVFIGFYPKMYIFFSLIYVAYLHSNVEHVIMGSSRFHHCYLSPLIPLMRPERYINF